MADLQSTTQTLKIETIYTDADTRTINLPEARDDITSQDIKELSDFITQNNLLIGDKTGAQFGRITKATKISKTTTTFDIQ